MLRYAATFGSVNDMDHKQLLKDLGGEHAVCTALKAKGVPVTAVAVRAWALPGRSIPAKYWAPLAEIAESLKKPVSFADLAQSVRAA